MEEKALSSGSQPGVILRAVVSTNHRVTLNRIGRSVSILGTCQCNETPIVAESIKDSRNSGGSLKVSFHMISCLVILSRKEVILLRTTITWSISLPPRLGKEAEKAAKEENRTKSELIREALRRYLEGRRFRKLQSYGAKRARELGITTEEYVVRLVHQYRGQRQKS